METYHPEIAILTLPKLHAKPAAQRLIACGIKGIWNFTAEDLDLPENVAVENVHMSDSLHALAYYMQDME